MMFPDDTLSQPSSGTPSPSDPSSPVSDTQQAATPDSESGTLIDQALSESESDSDQKVEDPKSPDEQQKEPTKEGEKPEEKKEEKKEEVKANSPESYEDFKLPEGITIPENSATEFKTLAKELNLSQEQAQKLVDMQSNFAKTHQAQAMEHYKQQVNEWKKEAIDALGANYKQELSFVSKAVRQFGGNEFKQILDSTGLGNHKEILLFLNKVGKSISEDKFSEGKSKSAPRSGADILYPSSS